METLKVAERELGHRGLRVVSPGGLHSGLSLSACHGRWRRYKAAARKEAHRRREPPFIDEGGHKSAR